MFRFVPVEEFVNACRRIDPNTHDLCGKANVLMDTGPFFTLAMAIVQIADEQNNHGQPIPRKPPGSTHPPNTSRSQSA